MTQPVYPAKIFANSYGDCGTLVHLYSAPVQAFASRPYSQNDSMPRWTVFANATSAFASFW